MAEGTLPQTSDGAIRAFVDLFALGFVLEGTTSLARGEHWTKWLVFWILAGVLSTVSYYWSRVKSGVGDALVVSLNTVATDARWWVITILVFFVYLGTAPLIREFRKASAPIVTESHQAMVVTNSDIKRDAGVNNSPVISSTPVPLSIGSRPADLTANAALDLINIVRNTDCQLQIVASRDNFALKIELAKIFTLGGCTLIDTSREPVVVDADTPPETPRPSGIIIHANQTHFTGSQTFALTLYPGQG